jgi:predicted permease
MRKSRALLVRILNLFGRERGDREFDEELESHLQMHTEDGIRAGLTPVQARREAILKLGGIAATRERYRDRRGLPVLETLIADVGYGFRMMRRAPAFSATVILTMALGIGATTAIFTVVNAVMLRPLPYREPDRIVYIHHDVGMGHPNPFCYTFDYASYRKNARTLSQLGGYRWFQANLTGAGEAERATGMRVTASLLSLLDVRPVLGRSFLPEEDRPGGPPVALISHSYWMRRYGGSPSALGRAVTLDATSYTIVGVLPEGFLIPDTYGRSSGYDLWTPFPIGDTGKAAAGEIMLQVVGRLKPGVAIEAARAEMDSLIRRRLGSGRTNHALVTPWRQQVAGEARRPLVLFCCAVGLVLLVACVNVANLLLSRAASRAKEMAMRRALGAGRGRVMRQLLTESLLLSLIGGGLGLLLALWAKKAMVAFLSPNLPALDPIRLDARVLLFNLGVAVVTGLAFGLAPGLRASGARLNDFLKDAGRSLTDGIGSHRLRNALVVFEVALATLLLSGAGLLFHSFLRLRGLDLGFRSERVLTFDMNLTRSRYPGVREQGAFFEQALARIQGLPGVESAALGAGLPLSSTSWGWPRLSVDGRPSVPVDVTSAAVTPDYLRLMAIPLLQGRDFSAQDRAEAPPVAIVNESFVRQFLSGGAPLGRRISTGGSKEEPMTVVGVVRDVRPYPEREASPQVFQPYWQQAGPHATFVVRTAGDPLRMAAAVRDALAAIDRTQPPYQMTTLEAARSLTLNPRRVNMTLVAAFAILALVLGCIGIYGVVAYSVGRRTHEIGVRMALGARQGQILGNVLKHGLALIGAGVALGLAAEAGLMRLMASQLWGVSATDPLTLATVAAILAASGIPACSLPARRAARVEPTVALRYE